jgi:hypothetical protein
MDAATGWCEGCLRTIDEIAAWSMLGDELRSEIWFDLDQRRLEWDRRRASTAGPPSPAAGTPAGPSP